MVVVAVVVVVYDSSIGTTMDESANDSLHIYIYIQIQKASPPPNKQAEEDKREKRRQEGKKGGGKVFPMPRLWGVLLVLCRGGRHAR